ncbi:Uncharacterised protein [Shigella sonnei]|nr:Uncharacterised protein [Shigella sonnei]
MLTMPDGMTVHLRLRHQAPNFREPAFHAESQCHPIADGYPQRHDYSLSRLYPEQGYSQFQENPDSPTVQVKSADNLHHPAATYR